MFFFLLPVIIFGFGITADVILRTTLSSFTERFKEMCLKHYWLYDLLLHCCLMGEHFQSYSCKSKVL